MASVSFRGLVRSMYTLREEAKNIYKMEVDKIKNSPEISSDLVDHAFSILDRIDRSRPQRLFFANELSKYASMLGINGFSFDVVYKVAKVAFFLGSIESQKRLKEVELLPRKNGCFEWKDPAFFRHYALHVKFIDREQANGLLQIGMDTWDTVIINRLLKRCSFSPTLLGSLVDKAFEKNDFETIGYWLMLYHYEGLTDTSKDRICDWLGIYRRDTPPVPIDDSKEPSAPMDDDGFLSTGANQSGDPFKFLLLPSDSIFDV